MRRVALTGVKVRSPTDAGEPNQQRNRQHAYCQTLLTHVHGASLPQGGWQRYMYRIDHGAMAGGCGHVVRSIRLRYPVPVSTVPGREWLFPSMKCLGGGSPGTRGCLGCARGRAPYAGLAPRVPRGTVPGDRFVGSPQGTATGGGGPLVSMLCYRRGHGGPGLEGTGALLSSRCRLAPVTYSCGDRRQNRSRRGR